MIRTPSGRHYDATFTSIAMILTLLLLQPFLGASFQQRSASLLGISTTTGVFSAAFVDETADAVVTTEDPPIVPSQWDEQFEELLLFQDEHGHCNFPQNPTATLEKEYPTLASFCRVQRIECNKYKGCSTSHSRNLRQFDRGVRCRRLEELGFEFNRNKACWYDRYHELVEFHRNNGHVRVSRRKNASLSTWVGDQSRRRRRHEGYPSLSETQINLLNRLDFSWECSSRQTWMEMYDQLVAFRNEHGNMSVTRSWNESLYCWIYKQRYNNNLSETRRKLLDDIGFNWNSNDAEIRWYASYDKLVEFKNKHGHFWVPKDNSLFHWIHWQRHRRDPLPDDRIRLLDEIDFPWIPNRYDALWLDQYNAFVRFQKNHGHCWPKEPTHPKQYSWSHTQRMKREKGRLTKEQITLLDKIGFPWERKRKIWIEMYNKLVEYCHLHGHLQVNKDDDPDLYDWMTTQRKRYHGIITEPAITENQIDHLEELHFCWSLDWKERVWHGKYTEVVELYKEEGHIQVKKKDNPSIYNWIQTQKERYKGTDGYRPLSDEEFELLEQIDFAFLKDQPRMAWNSMYAELVRYRDEHDGRLPGHKDDPKLNRWMRQQRHRQRSEFGYVLLSDEQKTVLESIECPMLPIGKRLRAWYVKYDELVEFWKQHGHFLVRRDDNRSLCLWLGRQRRKYKREGIRSEQLSRSQIYLLERIEFPWESNREEIEWQGQYDELVLFLKANGRFPGSLSEHPQLYKWIVYQRQRYKGQGGRPDISDHQIHQLEKIGFRWSIRE
ncbi:unnamed protein product [Cylindrotheca closterium]|uniref:Helicase-associated domain-containing protein n=1 Tax=Cylindrotheca closterium TaxID=2856 RepID=A0AAD2FPW9_9STRA|nr:unnamed protein product [Cylindrotheca closterium]